MSALSAYTKSLELQEESPPPPATSEEDASRFNARMQWLQSTITQENIARISGEIVELLRESVSLSVSYPTHKNADRIIQNLIRVDTLEKVLLSYKKLNK